MFEFLIAPLRMLIAALGTGELPTGGPTTTLAASQTALDGAADLTRGAARQATTDWLGTGGTAAADRAVTTAAAGVVEGGNGADISAAVATAAGRVKQANAELNRLADAFVAAASAAAPTVTPAALAVLVPLAADYLGRGLAVIAKTQAELAADARGLGRITAPEHVRTAGPAGLTDVPGPGKVPITLPDGSVAYAPNARAAAAVRAALSQRGVPYVWGGTTTDGFDCSGFTQWAYRQAGLELPRLAQDQDTAGFPVSQSQLQPGDLAVWSGHVAMYIGNGQLIETGGDPVGVTALRTTNADQSFEGFYRPR
ncbi:C40 family peptidase [Gordonia alkaliphila]|uniref:C40 family peptidase n=1 Tax=Gordonia alkaliphila TaxID=1053547 RepID=UPI001FF619A5|nr:C40 family peptidase [Gordonia alkaliphila]MCK0440022.1 C40 family peptidase [Gordonia alkaliphila]